MNLGVGFIKASEASRRSDDVVSQMTSCVFQLLPGTPLLKLPQARQNLHKTRWKTHIMDRRRL